MVCREFAGTLFRQAIHQIPPLLDRFLGCLRKKLFNFAKPRIPEPYHTHPVIVDESGKPLDGYVGVGPLKWMPDESRSSLLRRERT